MNKTTKTRREAIRLFVLAGFSLSSISCWTDTKKKSQAKAPPSQSTKPPALNSEETTIAAIEKLLHSKNVVYLDKTGEQYDKLRQGFNLRIQKYPSLIALVKNTEGVSEAIKLAKLKGLKVAVKSGGHSFEGFSSIDSGLQINMALLSRLELTAENTLIAGPAAKLKELYDYMLPKERILPAGSCGTVGLGGLTLGGGYGFFSRKYGLTCDHIQKATFVDGEGNIYKTVVGEELMWALKGGGNGNFGVVTEMEYTTHPSPKYFTSHRFKAYNLTIEKAKTLLKTYFQFASRLPETCFAAFVLNYKTMVLLITNYGEENEALKKMFSAFSNLADKVQLGKPKELASSLPSYYGVQHPIYFKNSSAGYYKSFESIVQPIDKILSIMFEKSGLIYQINTLGGKINDPDFEEHSCYPHRAFPYLSELQAYWDKPSQAETLLKRFNAIQEILYDSGIRCQYRNYPNLNFVNWEEAYYGSQYKKLKKLKKQYDPNDLFCNKQTIKNW